MSTFVGPPEFPLITRQSYFDCKSLNLQINQEKKDYLITLQLTSKKGKIPIKHYLNRISKEPFKGKKRPS